MRIIGDNNVNLQNFPFEFVFDYNFAPVRNSIIYNANKNKKLKKDNLL